MVGWFHVGVRPWGFGCLVACCGFPLSSGPLLRCDPCVGGSSGAGGGLDLMPVGRGGCWW